MTSEALSRLWPGTLVIFCLSLRSTLHDVGGSLALWLPVWISQRETPAGAWTWRRVSYLTPASFPAGPLWFADAPLSKASAPAGEPFPCSPSVCAPSNSSLPCPFRHVGGRSSSQFVALRYCRIAFGFPKRYSLLCK